MARVAVTGVGRAIRDDRSLPKSLRPGEQLTPYASFMDLLGSAPDPSPDGARGRRGTIRVGYVARS
jgi:hypothetical protein